MKPPTLTLTKSEKLHLVYGLVLAVNDRIAIIQAHTDSITGRPMSPYLRDILGWKRDIARFRQLSAKIGASMARKPDSH